MIRKYLNFYCPQECIYIAYNFLKKILILEFGSKKNFNGNKFKNMKLIDIYINPIEPAV